MENVIKYIFSKTLPNVDNMIQYILEQYKIAYSQVNEPCGTYNISKNIYETLLERAGLTSDDIKYFINNNVSYGYVSSNPFYNTLVIYMLTFLAKGIEDAARLTLRFYALVTVSYLKKKYFIYCNKDLLIQAIDALRDESLCRRGFVTAANFVADSVYNIYKSKITSTVDASIYFRIIIDIRTRLNQSVKHLAVKYYKLVGNSDILSDEEIQNIIANCGILKVPNVVNTISSITSLPVLEVEKSLSIIFDNSYSTMFEQMIRYLATVTTMNALKKYTLEVLYSRYKDNIQLSKIVTEFIPEANDNTIKTAIVAVLLLVKYYRS